MNIASTGASPEGEALRDTLWVDSTFPVLASSTVTVSPGSPRSEGRTVLVMIDLSMPVCMLIPWGYLMKAVPPAGDPIVLIGLSVDASPITTLLEPMQVRYQVRLSSEKTTSSNT